MSTLPPAYGPVQFRNGQWFDSTGQRVAPPDPEVPAVFNENTLTVTGRRVPLGDGRTAIVDSSGSIVPGSITGKKPERVVRRQIEQQPLSLADRRLQLVERFGEQISSVQEGGGNLTEETGLPSLGGGASTSGGGAPRLSKPADVDAHAGLYGTTVEVLTEIDRQVNGMLGGDPRETISARLGRDRRDGGMVGTALGAALDAVDPGHTDRALARSPLNCDGLITEAITRLFR